MDVLIVFLIGLAITTVTGHVLWLLFSTIIKSLIGSSEIKPTYLEARWECQNCKAEISVGWKFCGSCGVARELNSRRHQLRDLLVAESLFERLHKEAKIAAGVLETIRAAITAERVLLTVPPVVTPKSAPVAVAKPLVVPGPAVSTDQVKPLVTQSPVDSRRTTEPRPAQPPKAPRRSFSQVLNSFMEESNIRWGEIIGGLLIIGCSTALVVSLWAQISQIPVLKFLIFTTVTALLFGTGLYTEHRWKLPTTSRGILTIATLLVPLNFLAIAAVSSGETSGFLVLGSELLAPAIFLCLVYFAGRIITPGCAHLLAAGILGSSVGQLLVRHFASVDASPELQVALGVFPVLCYLASVFLALRRVLADHKVDEVETTTVFTILGTMSFAALLPFGLLLYKSLLGHRSSLISHLSFLPDAFEVHEN